MQELGVVRQDVNIVAAENYEVAIEKNIAIPMPDGVILLIPLLSRSLRMEQSNAAFQRH